ncbi:hypothetical protein PaG_01334 [Moesziomyces aphidis]|uniref:Non-structural maintenance of chromosomes element 4 n=1 Tax=Moesziomyces aphidis TaxID=84754 RepID=W3VRA5_MOEAP|nr:hypothetical protein PaG_01334 [Moesziomyces aphidis]
MPSTQETRSRAGPSSGSPTRPHKRAVEEDFTYNARQDVNDRRAVRSEYRALIAEADESKRDQTLKPRALLELIHKADELHTRVVAPSESVLDTKTLASMSEMGARMAKKMKLNADAFDTHELMSRLARFLGGQAAPLRPANDDSDDEEDLEQWKWDKLGRTASAVSRRAVTLDFMLGPLETQPKQRRTGVVRRSDDAPAQRTAPRALGQHDLQQTDGKESTSQIFKVAQLLKQQGDAGVCLFRFAVDPHSFVNTVENFFHVSFLIKENKASLHTDEAGNAILATAQPPSGEDEGEEEEMRSKQFIMEIDWATYLDAIQLYGLTTSIIPTRPNRVDPLSGLAALSNGS